MGVSIGDNVRFLNQTGGGIVIDISDGKCVVRDDEGMDWPMSESELVRIDGPEIYGNGDSNKDRVYGKKPSSGNSGAQKTGLIEVDLHQSALITRKDQMSPGEIHEMQKQLIRRTVEQHRGTPGMQIVFIHGHGTGVLRKELIAYLNKNRSVCTYEDAEFHKYGYQGAIKVTIKSNRKQ